MEVWIADKNKIESILRNLADKLKYSDTVSEMEIELNDQLSALQCHVSNRSSVERGEDEPDKPRNLKEALSKMMEEMDDMVRFYKYAAKMKRVQYDSLIEEGFTKSEAVQLVKDGFKM